MGWFSFARELDDFIFGLMVGENQVGKHEDWKGKWVFGSREMDSYGSTTGLKCVAIVNGVVDLILHWMIMLFLKKLGL